MILRSENIMEQLTEKEYDNNIAVAGYFSMISICIDNGGD